MAGYPSQRGSILLRDERHGGGRHGAGALMSVDSYVSSGRSRRLVALVGALAVILGGLLVAPAPALAAVSTFSGAAVDSDGTTPLVGATVCVNVLNNDGSIYTSAACTQTGAGGAFSFDYDISGINSAGLTVQAPEAAAGATRTWVLDKAAAANGDYANDVWALSSVNVSGTVLDSDGTALANASVMLEKVDENGNQQAFIWSGPASATGQVKLSVDFTANPRVRLTAGPAFGGSALGAATSFILTGAATGQTWQLSAVTVSGTIVKSDGTTPLASAFVRAEKVDINGNWLSNLGNAQADASGAFQMSIDFTANPRVKLTFGPGYGPGVGADPNGAETWVILAAANAPYLGGTYRLDTVTISGTVCDATLVSDVLVACDANATGLANASVMVAPIDADGNVGPSITSTQADSAGAFKLAVNFATYTRVRLTVGPPWGGSAQGASRDYTLTDASDPYLGGFYQLAPVNVSGKVCDAGVTCDAGATGLANASVQVEQVDANGNWLGFVSSSQSDSSGLVKISLDFTGSKRFRLTVGPPYNGSATGAATAFILTGPVSGQYWGLTAPNVTGVIYETDGTTPLEYGNVSLSALDANGFMQGYLAGDQTDQQGRFSIAVSPALLEAGANGVAVQVNLPNGYSGNGTSTSRKYIPTADTAVTLTDLSITIDGANAAVRVVDENGDGLQNAWVDARGFMDNSGANGQSNQDGYVYLALPGVSSAEEIVGREYQINAQAPWGSGGAYAGASVTGYFSMVDGFPLPVFVVELSSPNLKVKATDNGAAGGTPLSYTGLEIRGVSDPSSFSWANTDANGNGNISLEDGSYQLILRAPWNASGAVVGDRTYDVSVAGGAATLTEGANPVATDNGRYLLAPGLPTMTVVVLGGGSPVGGGWIEVVNTVTRQWVTGSQVRGDGKAGLVLDDGTYRITAMPPWGSGAYSAAQPCTAVVTNGNLASTTCGATLGTPNGDGDYELALQSPNLTFTVKGPSGDAGIRFANVCVMQGSGMDMTWNCATSNNSGVVSLYVDPPTGSDPTAIDYEIMPAWGSNDYARTAGTATWNTPSANVWNPSVTRLSTPNVLVSVSAGGVPIKDGWVSLVRVVGDSWEFIGGSNTGRNGIAPLNVSEADLSADLCLEVYPGWALAAEYGQYRDCTNPLSGSGAGTSGDPREVAVALQTANVRTIVLAADGTANVWGGVRVEQAGAEYTSTGLNDDGRLAVFLPDGAYTLWFYPGPNAKGAPVSLDVVVSGGTAVLPASVSLGSGNLAGSVTSGGAALGSAFISAVNLDTGQETGIGVAPDGTFVLSLSTGRWDITAYAPATGAASPAERVTVAGGTASPDTLTLAVN